MKVVATELDGVLVIEPSVAEDHRGFFFESYQKSRYSAAGIAAEFVQDNHAMSVANTLRGLHFQRRMPQGKLVRVLRGAVFDVAVDIRRGSPTFGRWVGRALSAENRLQLYVPEHFAHGYCVLEAPAEVAYKCTAYYDPTDQRGVIWNDPDVAIDWPLESPILSEKDQALAGLSEDRGDLPVWGEPTSSAGS